MNRTSIALMSVVSLSPLGPAVAQGDSAVQLIATVAEKIEAASVSDPSKSADSVLETAQRDAGAVIEPSTGEKAVQLDTVLVTGRQTANGDFGVKSGIPLDQMPQSVQVLDSDKLIEGGVRSIDDALLEVPSATVARSLVVSSASGAPRLRGLVADQMRNGIRQRFYNGVDNSALSNVERVEVLKGPSGVLYGQAAVGGLISIITKQPTDAFTGSVALIGGSYNQKIATLDVGGPITETLGVRLTGEIERSDSFVDYLYLDRENLGLTFAWRPSDKVSAHFVAEYANRRSLNYPGLPTVGTVISNGIATVSRSTFLGEPTFSLQKNHAPLIQSWVDFKLNDAWTLTPRLQYSEFNNLGRSTNLLPPDPNQPTLIPRQGSDGGEHDQFYVAQLDLAGHAKVFGLEHKLLLGVEHTADRVPFRLQGTVACGVGPIDALNPIYGCGAPTSNFAFLSQANLDSNAVYAQDQIVLSDPWQMVAGIRHSQSTNDNTFTTAFSSSSNSAKLRNTSWQLGTTYALGSGVSLFGGYNTGYDLEDVTGSRKFDGTPFKPQTSDQAEAGVRLTRDAVHASVSIFRSHLDNVSVPDPAHTDFQLQEGQYRVQGIELEGAWSPLPGWWLQGGYAYLDGIVSETTDPTKQGARLAETPENSFTASSRVKLGAVELRAGANYAGARKVLNGGAVTLPGYTTFDLGAGSRIGTLRVDAALTNVFDKTYYYSDNVSRYSLGTDNRVLPGQPRSFSLRLAYNFGGKGA